MLDNRERWRDEERETNASARKDRWREGDKELGDTRKVYRSRAPSERFADSGNKDASHDPYREDRWNPRCGPDGKETDATHEKWTDSSKDGPREKWTDRKTSFRYSFLSGSTDTYTNKTLNTLFIIKLCNLIDPCTR